MITWVGERSAMTDQLSDREARADRYFQQDLKGEQKWYAKPALTYKNWPQLPAFVVIAAGAATSFCLSPSQLGSWAPQRKFDRAIS
jgi:hypothetical protein